MVLEAVCAFYMSGPLMFILYLSRREGFTNVGNAILKKKSLIYSANTFIATLPTISTRNSTQLK